MKQRGSALHPVYGVLEPTALQLGGGIKQALRARSAQPYTLTYAMHALRRTTEAIRLSALVTWSGSGARVSLHEIVAEPGLSEETQNKLKAMMGSPAP